MLAAMHTYLSPDCHYGESLLDLMLAHLIEKLQDDFCRFADCGAGIGESSRKYAHLLNTHLSAEVKHRALVACFEPLPENFVQLKKNLVEDIYALHQQAVSDEQGTADFQVPGRMSAGNEVWAEGTSFGGTLKAVGANETIQVDVIKLQDSYERPFDFIKLDLQGGELKALRGLEGMLDGVKLLYVESQLLSPDPRSDFPNRRDFIQSPDLSADFLNRKGFITFYDGIQFGLMPQVQDVPLGVLDMLGIEIIRLRPPNSDGLPFILWARIKPGVNLFDAETLTLKSEVAEALFYNGVSYMQADFFAFKPSIFPMVMRHLVR